MSAKMKKPKGKTPAKTPKRKAPVFVLIDEEGKYHGGFSGLDILKEYAEKENIVEGRILKVTAAMDIYLPEEPDYEISDKDLNSLMDE